MAVSSGDDGRGPRVGLGRPNRRGGCRLWRRDRVPRCFGNKTAFLCSGYLVTGGSLDQAAEDLHPRVQRPRSACQPLSIRATEAKFGSGCSAPRQRLEEDPLARGIKGLAEIAVPCRAGATLAWVRGWRGSA